jgi:hypothetical protein
MFGRWRRALERKGFNASDEHGWDLRKAQLGEGTWPTTSPRWLTKSPGP